MNVSKKVARRIWYTLSALFVGETLAMFALAPVWNAGATAGEINALACFVAGAGMMFFLLAISEPGVTISTNLNRYMFAASGGLAFNVVVTWGLWAVGYPIVNGTVRLGLMESNYWLGPAILVYTVFVWLLYRRALTHEARTE